MDFEHLPHSAPVPGETRQQALMDPGFGTLFTDHVWTVHGQNAVQVGNLLGGDKIIKPGQCLSTGGIFGKPVFAPKQAKLPTPSPHTSPESFVDAAAPTPAKMDLMPGLLPL